MLDGQWIGTGNKLALDCDCFTLTRISSFNPQNRYEGAIGAYAMVAKTHSEAKTQRFTPYFVQQYSILKENNRLRF